MSFLQISKSLICVNVFDSLPKFGSFLAELPSPVFVKSFTEFKKFLIGTQMCVKLSHLHPTPKKLLLSD